ncbi:MAG: hypothetical protein AB1645_09630, partial [Bacillota bacterium]
APARAGPRGGGGGGAPPPPDRGLLVHGFDRPPVLMNSYNPPYYVGLFERYGFEKFEDFFAYFYRGEAMSDPPSRRDAERSGGLHYKTYRICQKAL